MPGMTRQVANRNRLTRLRTKESGTRHAQTLLVAGGILGALAASSCCIAPLKCFGTMPRFGATGV